MFRVTVLALLGVPVATAAERLDGPYRAHVERVIDGDSFEARVAIWLGQDVRVIVRLAGIDTAELRSGCESARTQAKAATDYLRQRLGDGPVMLTAVEADKFGGRVVARVADATGDDLSAALVAAGLARPYGGRRPDWCAAP